MLWRKKTDRHLGTRVDGLIHDIEELRAVIAGLQLEWEDTKHQVRRSYQRLEKAAERAGTREGNGESKAPCVDGPTPFSSPLSADWIAKYKDAVRRR